MWKKSFILERFHSFFHPVSAIFEEGKVQPGIAKLTTSPIQLLSAVEASSPAWSSVPVSRIGLVAYKEDEMLVLSYDSS